MKFMKIKVLVISVLILTGCATANIVPTGTNTYMISQMSAGGVFTNTSKLKSDVILRANAFAESKNKIAIPITSTTQPAIPGRMPSFEYQFRLVDKDDPRADGGELRSTPDNINEHRVIFKQE
ncbi:hypothetical protein [Acinetobacter sp. ANC 4173]|uniref:hypothetical protein n=1 Tax=Acinetobacter sp. ANC 4173 TaxID=2529837 RepID=UPI00103DF671|nr:hypothetical protein [Acinetobacter sp. ANC 4173]TCB77429.1 hypothetical protein E0H94_14645 [Acinetobacter sp. ANC 4173]